MLAVPALKANHKTISKIVLKCGLGAGIGAWFPKGSTLKATTVVFSDEVYSTFTAMNSRTLSDHVRWSVKKNPFIYRR